MSNVANSSMNERLDALALYGILDTPREARFDSITRALADKTKVPIAYIAFLDDYRLWMKSSVGIPFIEIPIETSMTAKLLATGNANISVSNLETLEGFKPGVYATDRLGTKSMALEALATPTGVVIGAICIMDVVVREFGSSEMAALQEAAASVGALLEIRRVFESRQGTPDQLDVTNIEVQNAFEENIEDVVSGYLHDTLENFDWWAAQAWWYESDQLVPGNWQIAKHTPISLRAVAKSRFGSDFTKPPTKLYLEPQLVSVVDLDWMQNHDRLIPLGARFAVVMDVLLSADPAVRLVFIVPSPRFFDETITKFFAVTAALLPKVITRERVRGEMEYRSVHDPLTGLLNRRGLNQLIEESEAEVTSNRAVMFLDLDNFKSINDKFGHAIGDELLIHVAQTLTSNTRPTDTVARIGGDEFVIVTAETNLELGLKVLAERVSAALSKPATLSNGVSWTGAASIGVASWPAGSSFDQSLEIADAMMYNAKKAGGGVVYESKDTPAWDLSSGNSMRNVVTFLPIAASADSEPWALYVKVDSKLKNPDLDQLAKDISDAAAILQIKSDHYVLHLPKSLWFDQEAIPALLDKLRYLLDQAKFTVVLNGNGASTDAKKIGQYLRSSGKAQILLTGFGAGNKEFELLQTIQPAAIAIDVDLAAAAAASPELELSVRAVIAICDSLGLTSVAPFDAKPNVLNRLSELGCKHRLIVSI